ncbi:hypothetical protein ACIQM0_01320 [Streptomyces sp. NPDC091387]|uniref:hypothetical protein n=1 Tax=Streptomyces sp. NPDC091387 TaxID=3365998 RepID=UPI0038158E16
MGVGVGAGCSGAGGRDGSSPAPPPVPSSGSDGTADGSADGTADGTAGTPDGGTDTSLVAAGAEAAPSGRGAPVPAAPEGRASVAGTTEGLPAGVRTGPGGAAVPLAVDCGAGAAVTDVDSRT